MLRVAQHWRMSRDHYSMLIGKFRNVLQLDVLNIKGQWEKMDIHEDTMRGFALSAKCVLVCTKNVNPKRQTATIYCDTFEKVMNIHADGNEYRLVPMYTHNVASFEAMVDISRTPGSPFHIDHRVDYAPFRCAMTFRSPVRAAAERFFNCTEEQRCPVDYIHFDGCFIRRPRSEKVQDVSLAAALLYCKGAITREGIEFCANQWAFCRSPEFLNGTGLTDVEGWAELKAAERLGNFYLFYAGETTMVPKEYASLTASAHQRNVLLYHRHPKTRQFVFAPPLTVVEYTKQLQMMQVYADI